MPPVGDGGTVTVPKHRSARLRIDGLDEGENPVPLESQMFSIKDTGVATVALFSVAVLTSSMADPSEIATDGPHHLVSGDVVDIAAHSGSTPDVNGEWVVTVTGADTFTIPVEVTVGGTGGTMTDHDTAIITPAGGPAGRSTLYVQVDGDPGPEEAPLAMTLTVAVVPGLATSLRFAWSEDGGPERRLPQTDGTVLLAMGRTATLRVEGHDADGEVVPLDAHDWDGSGTYFTVGATADPNTVTITPVQVGPYDPVVFTGDADITSDYEEIIGIVNIRIVAAVPVATHLDAAYELG